MKQQIQTNKIEWKEVELGKILGYEQPGKYIIQKSILKEKRQDSVPVLTANKSFILGYTQEKERVYNNYPVIIFDDFTTDIKFVDFSFKVKSSAMKLLSLKNKDVNLKFVFLMMKGIKVNFETHKRYYLSIYQHIKIPLPFSNNKPDLKEQERIVNLLEKAEKQKELGKKAEELLDEYLKSVFWEMFLTEKGKGGEVEIKDLCKKLFAGGDVPKDNFSKDKTLEYQIPIYSNGTGDKALYGYTNIEKVKEDSVTISARGTIGFPVIREAPFYPIIRLIVATPDINKVNIYYFREAISMLNFDRGGTSIPQLPVPMIKHNKIPLPPLQLQQKFASIVEQVEKMKEEIKQINQNSEELFNSLMSKAFRGGL
jgi:restriction endonuclease S subunit